MTHFGECNKQFAYACDLAALELQDSYNLGRLTLFPNVILTFWRFFRSFFFLQSKKQLSQTLNLVA